jgi:hypothetical protein
MCAITFVMMNEVKRKRFKDDEEFYYVSHLKYFVTRLNGLDVANNRFMSYSISTIF